MFYQMHCCLTGVFNLPNLPFSDRSKLVVRDLLQLPTVFEKMKQKDSIFWRNIWVPIKRTDVRINFGSFCISASV